jgi:hypothetical protein
MRGVEVVHCLSELLLLLNMRLELYVNYLSSSNWCTISCYIVLRVSSHVTVMMLWPIRMRSANFVYPRIHTLDLVEAIVETCLSLLFILC